MKYLLLNKSDIFTHNACNDCQVLLCEDSIEEIHSTILSLGEGSKVHVYSFSTVAKSLYTLREFLMKCIEQGVSLVFIHEQIGFADEGGNTKLLGALVEFNLNANKENQKHGIAKAKKEGKYKGRPKSITVDQYPELVKLKDIQKKSFIEIGLEIGRNRQTVSRAFKEIRKLQRQGKDPRVTDMFGD